MNVTPRFRRRGSGAEYFLDDHPGDDIALILDEVSRTYGRGRNAVHALRGVSWRFYAGTFTAIMGASGSGKSTLIQCAAGLDKPNQGKVVIDDIELSRLREPRLTETRRKHIGFVFQSFNLLPALTARQNIVLPMELDRRQIDPGQFDSIVRQVGIQDLLARRPAELSGGQQQRVAIARALLPRPRVIFADEPTGALDLRTAGGVLRLLRSAVDDLGQTLVMVTHDPAAAAYADRVLMLSDGQIVDELVRPDATTVATCLARLEA